MKGWNPKGLKLCIGYKAGLGANGLTMAGCSATCCCSC